MDDWGRAELLITGEELLIGRKRDVNGPFLLAALTELGIACQQLSVIGDDAATLTDRLRTALRRSRLVIVTGGLGPTLDDITRGAIATAVGRELVDTPPLPHHMAAPEVAGCVPIENPKGSATGTWLALEHAVLVALPGVPWELEAMWPEVARRITELLPAAPPRRRLLLHTAGLTEREVERRLEDVLIPLLGPQLSYGITAQPLTVDVHLSAGDDAWMSRGRQAVETALGDTLYGTGDTTLVAVVGDALRGTGRRVAVAESCTGGAISALLASPAGASDYLERGAVTYSNDAKEQMLGVPHPLLLDHGAVSDPVARAMASGLLTRSGANVTLAVTGIAGPSGGSADKPVGTVYMALADAHGTFCQRFHHRGDRARVVQGTVNRGLDLLRHYLAAGLADLERRHPGHGEPPIRPTDH